MTKKEQIPLFSLNQAVKNGVCRVYSPKWSNLFDHIKIDIHDGNHGPWVNIFSPLNEEINGQDPIKMLWGKINPDKKCFYSYVGSLPDSDEYKKEITKFNAVCNRLKE